MTTIINKFPQILTCLLVSIFLLESCLPAKRSFPNPNNEQQEESNPQQLPISNSTQANLLGRVEPLGYAGKFLGDLEILPNEILNHVLFYVGSKNMGNVRNLNTSFYTYTTGYEKPGQTGVHNKPDPAMRHKDWGLNTRTISFGIKEDPTLSNIMSLPFYQLTREVINMPSAFWPYIKDTQVTTLYLKSNQIGLPEAIELAKSLKDTQVTILDVEVNNIGDRGAIGLGKNLKDTQVTTLYFKSNKIGDQGAIGIAENLQGTQVTTLELRYNNIGDQGAIGIAENLQGTKIAALVLRGNNIGGQTKVYYENNTQTSNGYFD